MEPDADVLEMVRRQLDRDSPPSTEALYGRATRINDEIYQLSLRQFNATYVLRVKRERKRAAREAAGPGAERGGTPDAGAAETEAAEEEKVEPRPGGFLEAVEADEAAGDGDDRFSAPSRPEPSPSREAALRARIHDVMWRFARDVVTRPGADGAVAAVEIVDGYVEEMVAVGEAGSGLP